MGICAFFGRLLLEILIALDVDGSVLKFPRFWRRSGRMRLRMALYFEYRRMISRRRTSRRTLSPHALPPIWWSLRLGLNQEIAKEYPLPARKLQNARGMNRMLPLLNDLERNRGKIDWEGTSHRVVVINL